MSNMLASDLNNPNFVGAMNPDDALGVRFYTKAVQNPFESSRQGRPIFEDVVYVEIHVSKDNIIDTPAREHHKNRFHRAWAAFKEAAGGETGHVGTPLTAWPMLTKSQAEELRGLKFFTVEMLAAASDENINRVGMIGGVPPLTLRDRAKAYLAAAAGNAQTEHTAAQLAEMKRINDDLQKQLQALIVQGMKPKGKPGRPAKAKQNSQEAPA